MTNNAPPEIKHALDAIMNQLGSADDPIVVRAMIYLALLLLRQDVFRIAADECREMMARFVEGAGDQVMASSIRANWNPAWGRDPKR